MNSYKQVAVYTGQHSEKHSVIYDCNTKNSPVNVLFTRASVISFGCGATKSPNPVVIDPGGVHTRDLRSLFSVDCSRLSKRTPYRDGSNRNTGFSLPSQRGISEDVGQQRITFASGT